ncbi:MAG: hypothetical protein HZC49_03735 [Nitrospirae bacterium]|nr:hypothetical protein [Nitrospirota bacterium]
MSAPPAVKHNIPVPPLKFIAPEDKKQWEGEINGKVIAYFRLEKERGVSNVVVSTVDNLPDYFKRIEYFDSDGDGSLDLMSMKIYEKEKGWRDVGITNDNKYGLAYADSQYKELLEKIKEAELISK